MAQLASDTRYGIVSIAYRFESSEVAMDFYDAVFECANNSGISIRKLSATLGHAENYISNLKSMGRVTSVENASKILSTCGYVLCAIPLDEVAEGTIIID